MATASATPARISRNLPPGPKGQFLIGNLLQLGRDWMGFLTQCAREYGDVVYLRFANVPICLLTHPDDIEQVLVGNAGNFVKSRDYRALVRVLGNGLLTSEGEIWRRQRRLIQPAFRRENIASYGPIMVESAGRMLSSWQDGQALDLHEEMMRTTLEIVARSLFGADVSGVTGRVGAALQVMVNVLMNQMSLAFLLPFDLPTLGGWRLGRAVKELDRIVEEIIRQRRFSHRPGNDLLDTLLLCRDEEGREMSNEQVRDEVMTLLIAGHETTAIALSWTCYLLAQHPEAETRLLNELHHVLGDRPPATDDLPRLRFTEMIVKEAMRLYPPAWGIGRRALGGFDAGPYRLPAGTNVFILQWTTQRDPRFFPDPERFDPERWRDDPIRSGKIPRFAYFPFGGGPRVCVGASFAMLEAVFVLAMIFQRFHLALVPGHPIELLPSVTLRPKHGIQVVPHRRDAHN